MQAPNNLLPRIPSCQPHTTLGRPGVDHDTPHTPVQVLYRVTAHNQRFSSMTTRQCLTLFYDLLVVLLCFTPVRVM